MGLFKSNEERRLERDMEIRRGINNLKREIRTLEKDERDLVKKAKRAKKLGDEFQLNFIKANLKRTAFQRRLMERQILNIETFNQLKNQAEAHATFANSLQTVSQSIAEAYGSVNLAEIQKNCEMAIMKAENMSQAMEMMLEQSTDSMLNMDSMNADDLVSDKEIDSLIEEEVVQEEERAFEAADKEIDDGLDEIERELGKA